MQDDKGFLDKHLSTFILASILFTGDSNPMELLNPETETLRDTRDKTVFKLQDFEFSFYCIKLKKKSSRSFILKCYITRWGSIQYLAQLSLHFSSPFPLAAIKLTEHSRWPYPAGRKCCSPEMSLHFRSLNSVIRTRSHDLWSQKVWVLIRGVETTTTMLS